MELTQQALADRILYEREGLIVVDKPPDLPTSGRTLDDPDCLQYALIAKKNQMVWAVHQLDADTSGVNVFVTKKSLVSKISSRMRLKFSRKEYLVLVHGVVSWNNRIIKAPIGKLDPRNLGVISSGKASKTGFQVLSRGPNHTLLCARLFSGRTHQIRIHLAHIGHPVVGEEWYRKPACSLHFRQALHAYRLHLSGDPILFFEASLPKDLVSLFCRLQIDYSA